MKYSATKGVSKSNFRRLFYSSLIVAMLVVVTISVIARQWYVGNTDALDVNSVASKSFVVASGSSVSKIANSLEEAKLIKSASAFEWYVRAKKSHDKLQAGTYRISPSQTVPMIVDIIKNGDVATKKITILPASTLDQTMDSFYKSGLSKESIIKALDPKQYSNHPALTDKPENADLEGYLSAETFQIISDTELSEIVVKSLDLTAEMLTPELRTELKARGLSVHQAIILASIIEQEVNNSDDRPTVSQVFQSRLAIGEQLGSDVTAFYGAKKLGLKPTVSADSPYNTRLYSGLPPGPIGSVSKSSIYAVAYPAKTDFLFFVAGDDGVTHFSRTVEEHDLLVKQYCTTLCQ
jgi:UPF0755 protein